MDYTTIINILIKVAATVVGVAFTLIVPKIKAWLEAKVNKEQLETIEGYVYKFCSSADQLFKSEDPDGSIRKEYVCKLLVEMGIEVTDQINAIIEGTVFNLKK